MKKLNECKILIAGENTNSIKYLKDVFNKDRETTVFSARTADIAVEIAWRNKPDVIISEIELLDLSGWDMLGILKKNDLTRSIPFVMVDSKDSAPGNEVKALNLGVDEYIHKPFMPEVLNARVKAILKRSLDNMAQHKDTEETLKIGDIVLNMSTHEVFIKSKKIDLTPKEFALLYLFMKKQNRVLNRVFLSGTIWEREYFDTSHTIDKHIANLRKKLGKEGKRIETLPTIGYKFIGEDLEGMFN
jgi:DNA-binding response OmpR family regulator